MTINLPAIRENTLPISAGSGKNTGMHGKTIDLDPSQWKTMPSVSKSATGNKEIIEKYTEGYAKNHPGSPSYKPLGSTGSETSLLSRILARIPESVQSKVQSVITWGKAPVGESRIYQGISDGATSGLSKLAVKASEVAAKDVSTKGFLARMVGKAAGYIAPAAKSTEGFIGKMGGIAKGGGVFTKGNVAIAAAFEATDIIEGFKEGRGIKQTVQSTAKVGAGLAGGLAAVTGAVALGLISGPVGWAALAVGAVGSAVGYMAGGKATSFLGHNKKGLFQKEQVAAAPVAQQAPQQAKFGSMTMANGAVAMEAFDMNNPTAGLPIFR